MVASTTDRRPRRDVSARTATGECDYCGGNATSLLGGEHIFKCSEIVPNAVLEEFVDDLRTDPESRLGDNVDHETVATIATELEEVLEA